MSSVFSTIDAEADAILAVLLITSLMRVTVSALNESLVFNLVSSLVCISIDKDERELFKVISSALLVSIWLGLLVNYR